MPIRLAALLLLMPSLAAAADFSCRNENIEIACDRSGCQTKSEDEFTPMSLSREGRHLTICAYSGCWSGPYEFWRPRGNVELFHARVRRRGSNDTPDQLESLAVIYDRRERTAQIRFLAFSNPMTCG